ncbi:MAG: hypothetical protein L0I76_13750 [Pseudonocardia sp.]|nr:hypothetical protein [Pseudonocardia sp.]
MPFGVDRVVPIMRIFDEARAREFYLDYLGCTLDWEHRLDAQAPLYMQVSRGELVLHLSEHHGDGKPGHTVYVAAHGVRELHTELQTRNYRYLDPGLEPSPGAAGGACVTVHDPFGNCLRIDEREHSRTA